MNASEFERALLLGQRYFRQEQTGGENDASDDDDDDDKDCRSGNEEDIHRRGRGDCEYDSGAVKRLFQWEKNEDIHLIYLVAPSHSNKYSIRHAFKHAHGESAAQFYISWWGYVNYGAKYKSAARRSTQIKKVYFLPEPSQQKTSAQYCCCRAAYEGNKHRGENGRRRPGEQKRLRRELRNSVRHLYDSRFN